MPDLPPPDWAAIRRRYEATSDPVAVICTEAGIDRSELERRRKKETWRRSQPRPFPAGKATPGKPRPAPQPPAADTAKTPRASRAKPQARKQGGTPANRRRLLDRLVAAISLKLEQLERRMTQDLAEAADDGSLPSARTAATATDHERETRAIGALIDNLSKLTEIETDIDTRARGHAARPAAELADEAERRRRELAERLERLVRAAAG